MPWPRVSIKQHFPFIHAQFQLCTLGLNITDPSCSIDFYCHGTSNIATYSSICFVILAVKLKTGHADPQLKAVNLEVVDLLLMQAICDTY